MKLQFLILFTLVIFNKKKKDEAEKQADAFLKDEYYDLGDKPADSTQGG